MKRIELAGATFTYGGRLLKTDWALASATIEAAGGSTTLSISQKLDCFVAGLRCGSKLTQAMTRGAVVIDEDQFATLLDQGYLELEDRPAFSEDFELDEAIAELRSVFDGPPTPEAWTQTLTIIERCDHARLEQLVEYTQDHLARWEAHEMPAWVPPEDSGLTRDEPKYWENGLPCDELRAAPPSWIFEMIRGDYSPRHALTRALNLEGFKLNKTLGEKILANPYLTDVRVLNLGIQNRFRASFYEALVRSEVMRTVRELWLYDVHMRDDAFAVEDHTCEALELLRVHDPHSPPFPRSTERGEPLLEYPCFADATLALTPALFG